MLTTDLVWYSVSTMTSTRVFLRQCRRILLTSNELSNKASKSPLASLHRANIWTLAHPGETSGVFLAAGRSRLTSNNLILCQRAWRCKHEQPIINEDDLEEEFMRGHGPGGQSVAKSNNCVLLKHKPTGVFVKCHETRSLDTNRKRARLRLQDKLDFYYHGDASLKNQEKREASIQRQKKKQKTNVKLEKLKAFKEREGLS